MFTETIHYLSGWRSPVPKGATGMHAHDAFEIVYHHAGRGSVTFENQGTISFKPHCMEIVPLGLNHQQYQKTPGIDCCILFHIEGKLKDKLSHFLAVALTPHQYPATELAALCLLPKPQNDLESHICNHRLTAALLQILTQANILQTAPSTLSRPQQLAQEAYDFIRKNWRTHHQIPKIAAELGISPHYLRHLFLEHTGMTVHDCITHMRIDHAKDLLENSQLPQKAIASVCGFAEIHQFSRRFSQITGRPPGEYRRKSSQ